MMIKISTAFVFLIVSALAQNGHMGYDYRVPAIPFQMPTNLRPNANVQQTYYNNVNQLQNGFVPSSIYHQNDNFYKNQQLQNQQASQYYQGYQSAQSHYQNENYNSYSQNFGTGNLLGVQSAQQTVQTKPAPNSGFATNQRQQPVITKHIYFHLPPPEDAVASVTPPPAPKKTYNIIFIKLPSQKSTNYARLQHLINQQAAESKTLIYVLVKKPETQPIQPVVAKPEVFFVKYKDPRNIPQSLNTAPINVAQTLQEPVPQVSPPGLLPGQINGHGSK